MPSLQLHCCNSVSNPPLTSLAVAATRTAATILLVAILLERKALEVAAYNDDIVSSPTIVLHVKISVSLGYIYFPICMFMYRVIFPPHKHDSNHTKVRLLKYEHRLPHLHENIRIGVEALALVR